MKPGVVLMGPPGLRKMISPSAKERWQNQV